MPSSATPADPKPDAPPLSAYWWEHQELIIATQDPAPGAEVYQWDSVAVTLGPPDPPVDAIVRQLPPLTLYEAAVPEKQRAGDD